VPFAVAVPELPVCSSGMTMVFKVADPKMLDTPQQGDKVKSAADKVYGAVTVTAIEVAK
jgi:Cu(I)/Ag(I) efflux system periplasmic protein CusF